MTEQWLSIVEYAKRHDISDMTVRRRIRAGKVNAELREGKYFIQVDGSTSPKPTPASATPTPRAPAAPPAPAAPAARQGVQGVQGVHRSRPTATAGGDQHQQHLQQLLERPPRQTPPPISVRQERRHGGQRAERTPQHTERPARPQKDDFSYPELDLAGTRRPSASVLDAGQSIEVQLSQMNAKLEHITQPWQQELLASLKTEITLKDEKIRQLEQKIEDLEMIVQMLDRDQKAAAQAAAHAAPSPAGDTTPRITLPPIPPLARP